MPDLRTRLLTVALECLMGLPPGIQRLLVRRPLVIDGQRLAPELQLMLGLLALGRLPGLRSVVRIPAAETLPIPEARVALRRQQQMVGGRQHVGAVRDLEVAGAAGQLPARLYTPTECLGADPAPTMLFIHGGGWIYGDLESHDAACRFLAERSGVQLLAIDYRLAPEHRFPGAVEDCNAAYRWLVEHAVDVNADPLRLAVGGDSAGGALAASTAVHAAENDLPLAFQLLIYPGADWVERTESRRLFAEGLILTELFMTNAEEAYFAPGADKSVPDASALRRTDFPPGLAPAHVVTAGFDPLRDEGEAYARLMGEHGVEVDQRRYPSMIHGFLHIVGAGHECPANNREIADRLRLALGAGATV